MGSAPGAWLICVTMSFVAHLAGVRHVAREEVRRQVEGGVGGPIEVEVKLLFAYRRR